MDRGRPQRRTRRTAISLRVSSCSLTVSFCPARAGRSLMLLGGGMVYSWVFGLVAVLRVRVVKVVSAVIMSTR